jgi:hypothetical protein
VVTGEISLRWFRRVLTLFLSQSVQSGGEALTAASGD